MTSSKLSESSNFAYLKWEVNLTALERLMARCPNLKSSRLNRAVPLDALQRILAHAPQLVDLDTGSYVHDPDAETVIKLISTFQKCKSMRSMSGFLEVAPLCPPAIYPICSNLTSLNLSYAPGMHGDELIKLIHHYKKLRRLWILDCNGGHKERSLITILANCWGTWKIYGWVPRDTCFWGNVWTVNA